MREGDEQIYEVDRMNKDKGNEVPQLKHKQKCKHTKQCRKYFTGFGTMFERANSMLWIRADASLMDFFQNDAFDC